MKIKFLHAVSPRPDVRTAMAGKHGPRLSPDIASMLRDPPVLALELDTFADAGGQTMVMEGG